MDFQKTYVVYNENYPIINILNNINMFELIYVLNPDLLQNFNKDVKNDNNMNFICYMKNLSGLTLDNFYIDINVEKKYDNNDIVYVVTNTNDDFDNIQFNNFTVTISKINDTEFNITIQYSFNEELYSKIINNILKKIIMKLFSNLQKYLCEINI